MSDTTHGPTTDPVEGVETPHRGVRIVHLVFGVIFLGVTGIWVLSASDTIQLDVSLAVVLPVVLILAGATGLVAMVANAARGRRTTRDPYDS